MATNITGPGIGGGGGASEIAAVSVGVYVVNNTAAGFTAVKEEAKVATQEVAAQAEQATAAATTAATEAAAAVEKGAATATSAVAEAGAKIVTEVKETGAAVAVEGAAAGKKFGLGIAEGALEGGHQLRKAGRFFHHAIAGALFIPTIAREAYEFGTRLGHSLWGTMTEAEEKAAEEETKKSAEKIAEIRRRYFEESNKELKGSGLPGIDPESTDKSKQRIADSQKLLEDYHKTLERLKSSEETLKMDRDAAPRGSYERRRFEEGIALTQEDEAKILKDIEIQERAITREKEEQVALVERLKTNLERVKQIHADELASERRLSAIREVEASRTAVDISRLRQLAELGRNQRFPPQPGTGIASSGGFRW